MKIRHKTRKLPTTAQAAANGLNAAREQTPGRSPALPSALSLCLAIMLLFGGCGFAQGDFSLAKEELPSSHDRLAGLFVTENYIDPGPSQLEYDASGNITIKEPETQKIYGSFNGYSAESPVSFPGLEGYGLYSLELPADESHEASRYNTCDSVFTDLHITASDEGASMEGSLYVSPGLPQHYYFHPVYQQADGQIYLLPGSGISTDSFADGQQFSHDISESVSRTENGETSETGYRYTVTVIAEEAPEDLELLFLDSSDQVAGHLSARELDSLFQADLPELAVPEDVSCLILKQTGASGAQIRYTAYDPASDYLEYRQAHGDGPLHTRQLHLIWP